ncbi:2-polyprenyl-6-methoxyphenol hydroxylase-like oxidoreductase [Anopheles sinensis]|uniref:2-polyprenyl-6-methoxyphenol hydroxylase-like oxidoreductase n=1 Tax=Anopheles sinensis TaxID=74873 RepID=A0A084VI38_ANOSI|nr:2-polyprenyl-6-methoxyphenol hydroxylase-like oxidoreductase [Anopheles sinensis]
MAGVETETDPSHWQDEQSLSSRQTIILTAERFYQHRLPANTNVRRMRTVAFRFGGDYKHGYTKARSQLQTNGTVDGLRRSSWFLGWCSVGTLLARALGTDERTFEDALR